MAARGKKPTPSALRLISGTHRDDRHGPAEPVVGAFGSIRRPDDMDGFAAEAWDRWIVPAGWLDDSRAAAALMFCELWRQWREDPEGFGTARIGQIRHLMSDLGLTDERNRAVKAPDDKKDPAARYLG